MPFKGTERRTRRELEKEIENIGGHLNACTWREHITLYAKMLDTNVNQALDILADILQNSEFREAGINLERNVILREISQLVTMEPANFTGSEVLMIDDDLPLAQFAIGFKGASWTDPDSVALMVMQTMLGSWNKSVGGGKHMGSELAQRVAINEIAESIMAFNTNYKDTGLFGIHAVAKLLTYGRRIPTAELFARIDAVDASTVKHVANKYIYDRVMAISAVGPIQELPDYNWFRRRTYWNHY